MTEEEKAEEYIKKDGTETEKLLNSVKLSITREEANVIINCIKQSYKDGYKDCKTEKDKQIKMLEQGYIWHDYDAGEDCYEDTHEGRWVKRDEVYQLEQANKQIEEKDKQIEELNIKIKELQTEKTDLLENWYCDHKGGCLVEELEAQIEKMKCCTTCENCNEFGNCFNALKVCRECVDFCNWKLKEYADVGR